MFYQTYFTRFIANRVIYYTHTIIIWRYYHHNIQRSVLYLGKKKYYLCIDFGKPFYLETLSIISFFLIIFVTHY